MNGIPHYLLITALLALALGKKRAWIAIPVSLLLWAPLEPHAIGILRGAFGELSVGSMVLTFLIALKVFRGSPILSHPGIKPTAVVITIASILLYGTYLGLLPLGKFAPYENAFFTPYPLIAFCLYAGFASWKGWLWPALWIFIALTVWLLGLHPSRNPWDCLFDPLLAFASAAVSIRCLIKRK